MRKLRLFLFGGAILAWIVFGRSLSESMTGANRSPAEAVLNRIENDLLKQDPKAATILTRLRENKDVQTLALASSMLQAENRDGLPGVHSLLTKTSPSQPIPNEVRLASLATNPDLIPTASARESFLHSHGTVIEILQQSGDANTAASYLQRLEAASRDPSKKNMPLDNAIAFLVFDSVSDPKSLAFFLRETASDSNPDNSESNWLEKTLTEIASMVELDDTPSNEKVTDDQSELIAEALTVARTYDPLFKQAIVDHGYDATVLFLFQQQGDLIQKLVKDGIPLKESLEVVFANQDYLESQLTRVKSVEECAARLVLLRNEKPSVWLNARRTALALRLHEDAPQYADSILERYGSDDIAALLYAGYEDEILFAAAAVAKFDDLAIYILSHYQETSAFHKALIDPGIGIRLIPYVAKFGDPGLDRLASNQSWLDKYFQPDGTPKEKEWWTQIPGGAIADVARNVANGHPNEWSELGWAALDVADAALLIASFGASGTVTTAAKQGGKTIVTKVTKDQAKKQILSATTRASSLAAKGSRTEAAKLGSSLLAKASMQATKVYRAIRLPATRGWRFVVGTGNIALKSVDSIIKAAKTLTKTWTAVPPSIRRTVYRSLLAIGLFTTLMERTFPAIGKIANATEAFVAARIKGALGMADAFVKALNDLWNEAKDKAFLLLPWCVYLGGFGLLVWMTWKILPKSTRLRHV